MGFEGWVRVVRGMLTLIILYFVYLETGFWTAGLLFLFAIGMELLTFQVSNLNKDVMQNEMFREWRTAKIKQDAIARFREAEGSNGSD